MEIEKLIKDIDSLAKSEELKEEKYKKLLSEWIQLYMESFLDEERN